MILTRKLRLSRAMLWFMLGLLLPVVAATLAYGAETVDYVTYIRYTGESITVAWDAPPAADNVTYTEVQLHHYEQAQAAPVATAKVPQPTNQVTFNMGRWGHWILMAKHCRPAATTGDPDECSDLAKSTDPTYAQVDGQARAWWVYSYVAPPTGGGIE